VGSLKIDGGAELYLMHDPSLKHARIYVTTDIANERRILLMRRSFSRRFYENPEEFADVLHVACV